MYKNTILAIGISLVILTGILVIGMVIHQSIILERKKRQDLKITENVRSMVDAVHERTANLKSKQKELQLLEDTFQHEKFFGFAKNVKVWLDYESLYYYSILPQKDFFQLHQKTKTYILGFHCRETSELLKSLAVSFPDARFVYVGRDLPVAGKLRHESSFDDTGHFCIVNTFPSRREHKNKHDGTNGFVESIPAHLKDLIKSAGEGNYEVYGKQQCLFFLSQQKTNAHFIKYASTLAQCAGQNDEQVKTYRPVVKMWEIATGVEDQVLQGGCDASPEEGNYATIITVELASAIIVLVGYADDDSGTLLLNRYPIQSVYDSTVSRVNETMQSSVPVWSMIGKKESIASEAGTKNNIQYMATFATPKEMVFPLQKVSFPHATIEVPNNVPGHLYFRYRSASQTMEKQLLRNVKMGFFKKLQQSVTNSLRGWSDIIEEYGVRTR